MAITWATSRTGRIALLLCGASAIAGCEQARDFNFLKSKPDTGEVSLNASGASAASVELIERDVEAPEVFQANDQGLWDGRPSLGGVWVAHPDVVEPERVIIRNQENGKFVIGALFKRERENPGPRFQVSSDAAAALGMLAGAPDALNVTALIRQEVPIAQETGPMGVETLPAVEEIEMASLDAPISAPAPAPSADPLAAASAALSKPAAPRPTPAATPASAPASSSLEKPFVQIGLFSVQQNADNAAVSLRGAGVLPRVLEESSKGKTYYRVTVGPAPTSADRAVLLKKVKDLGYTDAYFVRK